MHPPCHTCPPSLPLSRTTQGGIDAVQAAAVVPKPPAAAASPSPAAEPAEPAPAPAAPKPKVVYEPEPAVNDARTVTGVALGSGYYTGCNVQLIGADGTPLKISTTGADGRFTFNCGADCAFLKASLRLPHVGQPEGCADSLTGLPPPFDMRGLINALPEGAASALWDACLQLACVAALPRCSVCRMLTARCWFPSPPLQA